MTLREILNDIDTNRPESLMSDGANDWDAANLLSELSEEELDREAGYDENGHICFINEGGYLISPAAYRFR